MRIIFKQNGVNFIHFLYYTQTNMNALKGYFLLDHMINAFYHYTKTPSGF